jgi:NAD(P)-dependent dehydrogenase (short-subunit alcohol dehydrogenase family)
MTQNFAGKTALVTGGTSGIGRVIAQQLAGRGAHVIVSGREQKRGEETVRTIREAGGTADFVRGELNDLDSVRALAQEAIKVGGGHVDVLINNAGIYPFAPTADVSEEEFATVYDVNVKAPFFLVAELAPKMVERGHGAIVNLTTMVANYGAPGLALYGSSKAAVQLLTKSWAAEFGPSGVRVNAVSPGPTLTEGTSGMPEGLAAMAVDTPARRIGTPEEIAAGVVFLASDEASLVHGAILPVDGGRIAV